MQTKTLDVRGMTCGHCKMSVEGALKGLDGVSAVDVDLNSGKVEVPADGGCPSFTSVFTVKSPCASVCQNCGWTYVGANTVLYSINGSTWSSLAPNTSIALNAGDELCISGLDGPAVVCCYSHDEWCN